MTCPIQSIQHSLPHIASLYSRFPFHFKTKSKLRLCIIMQYMLSNFFCVLFYLMQVLSFHFILDISGSYIVQNIITGHKTYTFYDKKKRQYTEEKVNIGIERRMIIDYND